MSLTSREETRRHYPQRKAIRFSVSELAKALAETAPEVEFAYLLGSGRDGVVSAASDLDIAVFARPGAKRDYAFYNRVVAGAEKALPEPVEVDVAFLNDAHCVFGFEALKGRRLFVREDSLDHLAEFYSLTCREYEGYMAGIKRRQRVKREAKRMLNAEC